MKAVSPFDVDSFEPEPAFAKMESVAFSRAAVKKTFQGDLKGTGIVSMTAAQGEGGRGYVAVEWIEGELHGKKGGFALLHAGTQGNDGQWADWRIVPGSGTGELTGISGTGDIAIDNDGAHTFALDYTLPPAF